MTPRPPGEIAQGRALTRAFLFRFFENEITAGSHDLRSSFLWLLSIVVPPGLCVPALALFNWAGAAAFFGPDIFRRLSWADKTLYMGFGMVVTGAVSAVVWNALLVDRRDVLVLGVQPLRARTIVAAKLAALATYIGLLIAFMHTGAAVSFGLLGSFRDLPYAFRSILALFAGASLASAFVFLAVCAVQGVFVAALGPRLFARVSPFLQLLLVLAVLGGLVALPAISQSAIPAVQGLGVAPIPPPARVLRRQPAAAARLAMATPDSWVARTPSIWFLGVYETVLGTNEPVLHRLAALGVASTAGAFLLVLIVYPLAYRRMAVAALESPATSGGRHPRLARVAPAVLARRPATRAAVQFLLATIGRVDRHRFVLAMATAVAVALVLPAAARSLDGVIGPPSWRIVPVLALPYSVMACLIVGFRLAGALPGDLRAGWIFQVIEPDAWEARAGWWRVTYAIAVVPAVLAAGALTWRLWGPAFAVGNAAVGLAMGALAIEIVLFRSRGAPCAAPWRPRPGHLRAWWPVYLFSFLIFTGLFPALALLAAGPLAVAVGVILLATIALRLASRQTVLVEDNDPDAPRLGVLDLN